MIALNDDWLSWPPDELDSFFTIDTDNSLPVAVEFDLEVGDRQCQEVCHEKS